MTTPHRTDLLAQRFLDQDLTAEERQLFAGRMGHDGRLRRQVIALQQVATAASHLPQPAVSAAFGGAGVLERTSVAAPPPARASRASRG